MRESLDRRWPVVGVLGASGGLGASTFAALVAAAATGTRFLLDLDPCCGGVDVLLGIEAVPGARWSGVRLGGGRLDPAALRDGLPLWSGVRVLAADPAVPDPPDVRAVVTAARQLGPVVLDLPRSDPRGRAVAADCDLVVLLARPDVPGLTAARACVADLGARVGLVVRGGARRQAQVAGGLVGATVLGRLPAIRPPERPDDGLLAGAAPRPARLLAAAVIDAALASRVAQDAA